MKPKPAPAKPLRYFETAGQLVARTRPPDAIGGSVAGLFLLAFIGLAIWQSTFTENGAGLFRGLGMAGVAMLFFGFIPVVMLRRQRISLSHIGLESRFLLFGLPIWRNFIPFEVLRKVDSTWDGGSDEGACMRLLITTTRGESQWGVDADSDEIVTLGKRLNAFRKRLGSATVVQE